MTTTVNELGMEVTWLIRSAEFAQRGVVGHDYLGSDVIDGERAATFDERISRCYELAGFALLCGTAPTGSTLIHGTMKGTHPGARRIGHAWLRLPDGRIWEPIYAEIWADYAAWQKYADAKVERRYSAKRARTVIFYFDHWGRWHESRFP